MAFEYQMINLGNQPNDGQGDPFRTVSQKMNANWAQLIDDLGTLVPLTKIGAANGVAPLGADQKVPAANLPSYVDDVLEFDNVAAFPVTGEAGKIYVAKNGGIPSDPSRAWRWSGSTYVEIEPSPGSTDVVPEGSNNKYFTPSRVLQALTDNAAGARSNLLVYSKVESIGVFDSTAIPSSDSGVIFAHPHGLMRNNGSSYISVVTGHGACALFFNSTTEIELAAFGGPGGIVINGRNYPVPGLGSGPKLSPAGLAAGPYYIFVFVDPTTGALKLEASNAGHGPGAYGVEIKSGDATRTLVGFEYVKVGSTWQNDGAIRGHSSYFNGRGSSQFSATTTGTTTSQTPAPISNNNYLFFWQGETAILTWAGACSCGAANQMAINITIDTVAKTSQSVFQATPNAATPLGGAYPVIDMTEGLRSVGASAWIGSGGGTGTFVLTTQMCKAK